MEVGGPYIWNQTNWLQLGLQEQVQIRKITLRLMEKGFAKQEAVNYKDAFFPMKKWATIQTLFTLEP